MSVGRGVCFDDFHFENQEGVWIHPSCLPYPNSGWTYRVRTSPSFMPMIPLLKPGMASSRERSSSPVAMSELKAVQIAHFVFNNRGVVGLDSLAFSFLLDSIQKFSLLKRDDFFFFLIFFQESVGLFEVFF